MVAFWIFFSLSLLTILYGFIHDDARIIIGIAMASICLASVAPDNNTYICDGIEGMVEANRTQTKRWTLSNGDHLHSTDFHKKCKRVLLPSN